MQSEHGFFWCGIALRGYAAAKGSSRRIKDIHKHFGFEPRVVTPLFEMIINKDDAYLVLLDVINDGSKELSKSHLIQISSDCIEQAGNRLKRIPIKRIADWRASGGSLDVSICVCPSVPFLRMSVPLDFLRLCAERDLPIEIYSGPYDCQ
ncbi:MAG TPA: hypothetical protein VN641_09550 [Urbifossiella sp.]|nr:hypothetical protein [Urbifossiella sp.]